MRRYQHKSTWIIEQNGEKSNSKVEFLSRLEKTNKIMRSISNTTDKSVKWPGHNIPPKLIEIHHSTLIYKKSNTFQTGSSNGQKINKIKKMRGRRGYWQGVAPRNFSATTQLKKYCKKSVVRDEAPREDQVAMAEALEAEATGAALDLYERLAAAALRRRAERRWTWGRERRWKKTDGNESKLGFLWKGIIGSLTCVVNLWFKKNEVILFEIFKMINLKVCGSS